MKAEYIKNGRFDQAIWLNIQDGDFIAEYPFNKAFSMDKALELWNSLTTQLVKAGRVNDMTARELLR